MKTQTKFKEYIWLVNTIRKARRISFAEINERWIETEMSEAVSDDAKAAFLSQIPAGHPGSPADIAHAVCFLAQPESSYITGQVLCVDGGMAM